MSTLRVGTLTPTSLRKGTLSVTAAYLGTVRVWPLGPSGVIVAIGKRPTATINATFTAATGFVGVLTGVGNRPTATINATFTAATGFVGTIAASSNKATATINSTFTAAPAYTATIAASGKKATAAISATFTTPSLFVKYRSFNGSTDAVTFNLGNLAGVAANPQTYVCVARFIADATPGDDADFWITKGSPDWDPVDWYFIWGGSPSRNFAYWDGAANAPGPVAAPNIWVMYVVRASVGSPVKWSTSEYNGTSWPTPTHTTTPTTFGVRNYQSSGSLFAGGNLVIDMACIARFNTALTDAQVNGLTAGVAAIQGTPGCTNLWVFGQTTPADTVGTASFTSMTGTTLSSGNSPFPT